MTHSLMVLQRDASVRRYMFVDETTGTVTAFESERDDAGVRVAGTSTGTPTRLWSPFVGKTRDAIALRDRDGLLSIVTANAERSSFSMMESGVTWILDVGADRRLELTSTAHPAHIVVEQPRHPSDQPRVTYAVWTRSPYPTLPLALQILVEGFECHQLATTAQDET